LNRLRRLLPDGLAGRFALLLGAALLAANLVALGLLWYERERLDRTAWVERQVERIVSLVPPIEAAAPGRRPTIAREASKRFLRASVDPEPVAEASPSAPRSAALARVLMDVLPGREVRAATIVRRGRGDHDDREAIAVSVRLAGPEGAPAQWLNLLSRGDRSRPPGVEEEVFLIILGLSLVSVLGVGLLFVRRLTRPLGQLAEAARAAGRGDRTARVPEEGAREMREAAAAFNHMQAQIARFDAERMRTLAAVGHDLRTPITSLRIRAELLDEADAAPMIRTLEEMTVMAEGLVAFARGAGPAEETREIPLRPFLSLLCEERGALLSPGDDVSVLGRPVALRRAVGNLMDNALRYGGIARVCLERQQGIATIWIDDDGPGIPPERMPDMFEPFVRGEESRSADTGGAGLGLAIARNIIAGLGGTLDLQNRTEGGLRATVRLSLSREG
jgi:signal transduction histidine kinase